MIEFRGSGNEMASTRIKPKTKKNIRYRKWRSKAKDKPSFRNKEGGAIKPMRKKCKKCEKARVRYHHSYCTKCWIENGEEMEDGLD